MIRLNHLINYYTISVHEFADCIRATLDHRVLPESVEVLTAILMNDFCYSLISERPDMLAVELEETGIQLHALNFPVEQFCKVKEAFYAYYLIRHIHALDALIYVWKEHCEVYLSWSLDEDKTKIFIHIKPKPNFIDIDEVVDEIILKLIEEGKFVPYKYLRATGRL